MLRVRSTVLVAVLAASLVGCAMTAEQSASRSHDKPGFVTKVVDGRLWVFRAGSKEYETFVKLGEPAQMVTRIAAGPGGMISRSSDAMTIDDSLVTREHRNPGGGGPVVMHIMDATPRAGAFELEGIESGLRSLFLT